MNYVSKFFAAVTVLGMAFAVILGIASARLGYAVAVEQLHGAGGYLLTLGLVMAVSLMFIIPPLDEKKGCTSVQ